MVISFIDTSNNGRWHSSASNLALSVGGGVSPWSHHTTLADISHTLHHTNNTTLLQQHLDHISNPYKLPPQPLPRKETTGIGLLQ